MDPVTLLVVAAGFAASSVAQKCADAVIGSAWGSIKARFKDLLGREPKPSDVVSPSSVPENLRADPELSRIASIIFGSSTCLRRAQVVQQAIMSSKILWIDDQPENNVWERATLHALGAQITSVESTRSALACLTQEFFDAIVSDIARADSPNEGIRALPELKKAAPSTAVIFYTGVLKPGGDRPLGAFGITNRPDEVMHLILDVLERVRV